MKHNLTFAVPTFAIAGLVDVLGHLGPTGLLVGGLVSYAVYRHGPELLEQVGAKYPLPATKGRTWADRALGRKQEEAVEETPELEYMEPVHSERVLDLAPNWKPDASEIINSGVFVVGMRGSGKSYFAGRLIEQLAKFPLIQVVYDVKGDFVSIVERFASGVIMTAEQQFTPQQIIDCGVQVVVDLRTWSTMEERAQIMAELNEGLMEYTSSLAPSDREPWLIHLDEAQQFLSEACPFFLTKETWRRVTASFVNLGVLARSFGAVPCIYTQRIADIEKSVVTSQDLRIFMKAALDNDLDRYFKYIPSRLATREHIKRFGKGEAVVIPAEQEAFLARFAPRETRHNSETPSLTQALKRHERPKIITDMPDLVPVHHAKIIPMEAKEPKTGNIAAKLPPELQLALEVYRPGMSYRDLAEALKRKGHNVGKDTAGGYIRQLKAMRCLDSRQNAV